jgi:hypothetical protein
VGALLTRSPALAWPSKNGEDIRKRIPFGRPGAQKSLVLFGKWNRGWELVTSNLLTHPTQLSSGINGLAFSIDFERLSCALRWSAVCPFGLAGLVDDGHCGPAISRPTGLFSWMKAG